VVDAAGLPAYLQGIAQHIARDTSGPAAIAMGHTYERQVKANLARTAHPKYTFTPSPAGSFPSLISGALRRSVLTAGPFGGGLTSESSVAPHVFYAAVQEYGHTMHSHGVRPMTWYNGGRWWSKHTVHVPARPYMHPTTAEAIANGSLSRAAMAAFEVAAWGA
jgi:phage gpG-like protein